MGIIYKITSPSGRFYVGQTFDMRKRLNAHRVSVGKKNAYHILLINSFKKYGFDEHIFEILEIVENCSALELSEREMYWIKELNSFNGDNPLGMNMTIGGEGQRGKLDERRKEIAINNLKKGGNFLGRHHTEENKKLASIRAKERNLRLGVRIPKWGAEKGRLKVIKAVLCYDINGDFLREFDSLTDAGLFLNKTANFISDAIKRNSCSVGKYFFTIKTDNYPLKIKTKGLVLQNTKRKVLYLDKDLNIIKEYPSALEASEDLKVPKTTINRAAQYNKLKPIRAGHIFIYKNSWKL